ncbi:MAG: 50S ribosomal protein L4 [Bacilli bacterium]|jgi:large subunit ribosomal protein L4|nr:50S ribosomal protein L4 [Bacillota bacterium]NLM31951.1 50S ribosomal protein L4 [Acholeplasmataceae bacterium]HOA77974.1 50S ribosomal protein L4 [Bacilli bacterium]HPZ26714.1 50S ribosomal protein L4 [Bacilli bacterium]HQC89183.1 50S ribosomal protein L4 [Bacilli bacterium]
MPSVVVLNQMGEEINKVELNDNVFGIEPNRQAIYEVVNAERAAMRQGTHKTKKRKEVKGGGRKPWRQKGTGRSRQGSIRAPQWKGGGVVFGPVPRSHSVKVNKKVVKLALKSLLSDRVSSQRFIVVDKIELADFKTKSLLRVVKDLNLEGKIIFVSPEYDFNLFTAGRNIPNVLVQTKNHLSVYQLTDADYYVMPLEVVKKYEEELA